MDSRPDMPPLRRRDLAADPFEQLRTWYAEAVRAVPLADAMALATADSEGDPDVRFVLLKGFDASGLVFHTAYDSRKGGHLADRPMAAVALHWRELDRQVRARGPVERLPADESDRYFRTRPRERQLGAWASPQSRVLAGRDELDERVAEVEARFHGGEVPRPERWGGYRLLPDEIEFWQGQVGRLHDRFRYTREADGWRLDRLAP